MHITLDKAQDESGQRDSKKRNVWLILVIVILLMVVACLGAAVAYLQLVKTDDSILGTTGEAIQKTGKFLNNIYLVHINKNP